MTSTCDYDDRGTVVVITPAGEIDLASAEPLRESAARAVAAAPNAIVLDLHLVTFMDSTGLGIVAGLVRAQRERGARVVVCNAVSQVDRVIRMTGLDRGVELYEGPDLTHLLVSLEETAV
jgi:anti-anti-sigma factor